jgi:hypothetical protein
MDIRTRAREDVDDHHNGVARLPHPARTATGLCG